MDKAIWPPTLIWLGAVTAALALAFATPSEADLMGRLPTLTAKRLDQQHVTLPYGLPAERTLAIVAFQGSHRPEVESWIKGLRLDRENSIPWFKMPVYNDPGTEAARRKIENGMLERHTSEQSRARLLPVFTDREAFVRAAGLGSSEHAWVLVLDRAGNVLARAEGLYDEDKAAALRETLLAQN